MIAQEKQTLKMDSCTATFEGLKRFVLAAVEQEKAMHEVEGGLWKRLLVLGRQLLELFVHNQGTGDVGPTLTLPTGRTVQRLPDTHERPYRSIFGKLTLTRTVYGTRPGQKQEFVPLDNRLQLPAGVDSYVLQDWSQAFSMEDAFGLVRDLLIKVLGLDVPVDSLEKMNRRLAEQVQAFRQTRPAPPADAEGEVFVVSGDGKGVPMRRSALATEPEPARPGHRTKGQKAQKKKMAIVGTLYSVDRHVRTPADIVAALFREGDQAGRRPTPCHKHVWASLTFDDKDRQHDGLSEVFGWLGQQLALRNKDQAREIVCLMDGQEALWDARRQHWPRPNSTDILDLMHVLPRLWDAAHVFHPEKSQAAVAFVRARLLRILRGESVYVRAGLHQMATKRGLSGAKAKTIDRICAYLEANEFRMRYHEYLAKGYPIASGVIEGACRHYVKDRMERSGMKWTFVGAQAMLNLRSVWLNGDWDEYHAYRIAQETKRIYPHRFMLHNVTYSMAA